MPLNAHTTLKVGGPAQYMATVHTLEDIKSVLRIAQHEQLPVSILGGGSNVLVPDSGIAGIVLRIALPGIAFHDVDRDAVEVVAGAGVVWDELVSQTVTEGVWGLENLSGIPGSVGASPIQNIGAYGAELSDVCSWVEVLDMKTMEVITLSKKECLFSYRESIFKQDSGSHYIVTRVGMELHRNGRPNITYKDLAEYFVNTPEPTHAEIRDAVVSIRARKFPDMSQFGTAGSFFKNPIISQKHFLLLQNEYPEIPYYEVDDEWVKIPLAWILDYVCGLKGYSNGGVSLHTAQPLVLLTHSNARETDVHVFADAIAHIVKDKTNIVIEREVQTFATKIV